MLSCACQQQITRTRERKISFFHTGGGRGADFFKVSFLSLNTHASSTGADMRDQDIHSLTLQLATSILLGASMFFVWQRKP